MQVTESSNLWTFRIMPNEMVQGVDLATNADNRLNARTAELLYENTGIGNAKVFGGDQVIQLGTIWLSFEFEQKAGKAKCGSARPASRHWTAAGQFGIV